MAKPHREITIRLAVVEQFGAALTILWGIWMLVFGDVALTRPMYDVLTEKVEWLAFPSLSPAQSMGLFAVGCGWFYSVAIQINGRGLTWTPFVRMLGPIMAMFFFAYVAEGYHRMLPFGSAVLTHVFIAFGFFVLFYANMTRVWEGLAAIRRKLTWKP